MKNIHLIQTDKPSRLFKNNDILYYQPSYSYPTGYNLYITSDEEIKIGDWFLYEKEIIQANGRVGFHPTVIKACKKIILTTDTRLIADNIQAIDDEFLDWMCENPSCEYVEIVQEQTNNKPNTHYATLTLYKYKIIIPKGESKKNFIKSKTEFLGITYTLEDGSKQFVPNLKEAVKTSEEWQKQFNEIVVLNPDGWDRKNYDYSWYEEKITFTEYNRRRSQSTCKNSIPKKELNQEIIENTDDKNRLYNEEDLKEAFYMGEKHVATEKKVYPQSPDFETWFEQFKNGKK